MKLIKNLLIDYGAAEKTANYIANIITITLIITISYVATIIIKTVVMKILKAYAERTKVKWDDILIDKKVFNGLFHIIPFATIYSCAPLFSSFQSFIERIGFSAIIVIVLISTHRFLDAVNEIYISYEISKLRPIKGYLQVIVILLYVVSTILIISVLLDRSPWYLLSGIGAATAVLMLIFQNSILGLVASIQISSNNMLQIGDCIEMPKYGADGSVVEITLHTVKVQNFDKTITTIPTHLLITDSFKNWRGMHESGSRRIKRSIFIDVNSIRLLKESDIDRLINIDYINKYLKVKKETSLESWSIHKQQTNIGIFRIYLEEFLKDNSNIINDPAPVVRQLQPTERGLPVEIYAFTNLTQFVAYEELQADIFDHILAIISNFGLRIYQEPSGYDFTFMRISSNDN